MRGILLDWLVDLHLRFKMFPETLFTVAMIIGKYLMKKQVSEENLQLLGATAFFIAAKYEETYSVPEIKELVHLSANAFTKSDLLRLEADILLTLDFNLIVGQDKAGKTHLKEGKVNIVKNWFRLIHFIFLILLEL